MHEFTFTNACLNAMERMIHKLVLNSFGILYHLELYYAALPNIRNLYSRFMSDTRGNISDVWVRVL